MLHSEVVVVYVFFFFKQKTAYEIGTGDWSSDVCSSDLAAMRKGQYKNQGRCRNENWATKKRGAASTRNGQYEKRGAAATRNGQYKNRGRCRSENW